MCLCLMSCSTASRSPASSAAPPRPLAAAWVPSPLSNPPSGGRGSVFTSTVGCRLHHLVRGRARAGEGVRARELPGGCRAGVDHAGPGKVTHLQRAPLSFSMAPLSVLHTSLCVSATFGPKKPRRKTVFLSRNVFLKLVTVSSSALTCNFPDPL